MTEYERQVMHPKTSSDKCQRNQTHNISAKGLTIWFASPSVHPPVVDEALNPK
jgi:hypothetical protein